jgi:uncharacterized protein (TIGR03000 family)
MRRGIVILGLVVITLLTASNDVFAQRRGIGGRRGGDYYYDRGGYYYPGYYGYGYDSAPGYYYGSPGYYADPVAQIPNTDVRRSFYGDPNASTLRVLVPNADAQVWFDDAPTRQRGMERVFTTPPLQQAGTYTIKAQWTDNGRIVNQERQVQVQPGQPATVDFRTNRGENLPAPASPK